MISCGETGADVSMASTGPAIFDLANVAIDQTAAVATMSAMAAKMIILRMSCHPFQRGELTIALAHRAQLQGEGLHTVRFFAIARTYRARRRHWDRVCKCAWIGSQRWSLRASPENQRCETSRIVETARIASPAVMPYRDCWRT